MDAMTVPDSADDEPGGPLCPCVVCAVNGPLNDRQLVALARLAGWPVGDYQVHPKTWQSLEVRRLVESGPDGGWVLTEDGNRALERRR